MAYKINHADILDWAKNYDGPLFDGILCDPPYELGFMGKSWDSTGIAFNVELWTELLRICKPGAHLLAFSGSRTYHRMACAIEDAGFEIRDMIEWVYGSGFPKSLNIGKAVDKIQGNERKDLGYNDNSRTNKPDVDVYEAGIRGKESRITKGTSPYEGYGTALKPAHEPCVLARKPIEGTVANNCLKHGTGGLNIDGTRVAAGADHAKNATRSTNKIYKGGFNDSPINSTASPLGRFPANLIHDGSDEVEAVFPQTGKSTARTGYPGGSTFGGSDMGKDVIGQWFGDSGSSSRFFKTCELACEDVSFMLELEVCGHILGNQKAGITLVGVIKEAEQLTHVVEQFMSGKKPTENFLKDIVSTIRTTIKLMTDLKIYNALHSKSIDTITQDSEKTIELLMGLKNEDARSAKNISHLIAFKNEVLGLIRDIVKSAVENSYKNGERKTENATTSTTESIGSRFKYQSKASKSERNAGLEGFETKEKRYMATANGTGETSKGMDRFTTEPVANHHPTVKPLSLTKYLATLIKPPTGGRLLVPFSGSGSEMIGALQAGWEFVEGVELTEEYIPIAEARIKHWLDKMSKEQMELL